MDDCIEEQRYAIEAVIAGKSIFLTGPGGTGKSYLLKTLYEEFKKTDKVLAVTAMTGCAALLLGSHATTLHSWAGIGLGTGSMSDMIRSIRMNGKKKKNWKNTTCLVIDEVSMLTPELLAVLDEVGRNIRKTNRPFGGLQIVFVGDFYQLPPITNSALKFAFQSDIWNMTIEENFQLKQIHRQRDPVFQRVLEEARIGKLSDECYNILLSRKGLTWKGNAIRPTLLFTRNADVNTINQTKMLKLPGEFVVFRATTVSAKEEKKGIKAFFTPLSEPVAVPEDGDFRIQKLDKGASYEVELKLKVGAQVMLTINLNPELGLVNGSRGVVRGFEGGLPIVEFLSSPRPRAVEHHIWQSDGDDPVFRKQIPLRVAYALTIHKAQGASLDSALVDIGQATFECGQAYVALSRVRSLEALYVHDLDRGAFRADKAVTEFYSKLTVT